MLRTDRNALKAAFTELAIRTRTAPQKGAAIARTSGSALRSATKAERRATRLRQRDVRRGKGKNCDNERAAQTSEKGTVIRDNKHKQPMLILLAIRNARRADHAN